MPLLANAVQGSVTQDELSGWLESWRGAWEKGDAAEYISFYAKEAVQDNRRGRKAILSYKQRLWKRLKPGRIHVSNYKIYRHPEGFILVFAQKYSGDGGFSDSGYKTILTIPGAAGEKKWLIAEERWHAREPVMSLSEIKHPEEKKTTDRTLEEPRHTKQAATSGTEKKPPVSAAISNRDAAVSGIKKEEELALTPDGLESSQSLPENKNEGLSIFPLWFKELKLTPSLTMTQAYNDNVYFSAADRKGDWSSKVSPGLELTHKTERLNASLTARLDGIYYLDQHHLNTVDQFYRGDFRYALNSMLALGAEAGYSRDSEAWRDIEKTGSVFPAALDRQRYHYGVSGEWRPSERYLMTFLSNYQDDRYDNPAYSDLKYYSTGINSEYNLNPITKGRLSLGYSRFAAGSTVMDNYAGTMGISREISNLWSILVDAGVSYSQSRYDVLSLTMIPGGLVLTPQQQTNDEWGPMGKVTLALKHEKTNGSITLSSSVMPFSGTSTAVNRTNLSLDLNHKLTYELSGLFRMDYFINKSDQGEFSGIQVDEKAVHVVIGPRYHFSKDVYFLASYTYNRVNYGQSSTSADQHYVLLTFHIQHTLME